MEMMIVVAIVGVIAAIAVPNLNPVVQKQKLLSGAEEVANLLDRARRKAFNEGRCYRVRLDGVNLVLERKGGATPDGNGANCVGDAGGYDISSHAWDAPIQRLPPQEGLTYTIQTTDSSELIFRPNGRLRGDGDWTVDDDGAQIEVSFPALGRGVALQVTPLGRLCKRKFDATPPTVGVVTSCL